MSHWIYIERQHNKKSLAIGPYASLESATIAMDNASLIDMFCHKDCLECYVTSETPTLSESDIVTIDLNDVDHTGVGEKETDAVLTFLSYDIEKEEADGS